VTASDHASDGAFGPAWAHADGKGFNFQLEGGTPDGRITLREASANKE
jgi:hypothetical protein